MFKAKVKWNGNHYFSGEEVKGSKVEMRGKEVWLYDDEEVKEFPCFWVSREEWVEIDGTTLEYEGE